MQPLVRIQNLRYSYRPEEEVLGGIDLEFCSGEFTAITGSSGSGKSTLFYMIGSLLSSFEGSVEVAGKKIQELSPEEAAYFRSREIGFVFQQFHLLPRASVLENILLPCYYPDNPKGPDEEQRGRAQELARELGIEELLDRKPQELSGGQQQRVAIARSLIHNPPIILADEPTGNLDSKSSEAVMGILSKLNSQGKTVILITHSPELAQSCHRQIEIRDGRVVADSFQKKIQAGPAHTADLGGVSSRFSLRSLLSSVPESLQNIRRSKTRAALTMMGVSLGVAAVLTTLSLGSFAKDKILEGYEVLGVNTLRFSGWRNWNRSSQNYAPAIFNGFSIEKDLDPIQKIFSDSESISPTYQMWGPQFIFAGKNMQEKTALLGTDDNYFSIADLPVESGRKISKFDLDNSAPVCVIGNALKKELFERIPPVGKQVIVKDGDRTSVSCLVVGVLASQKSNEEWLQPDRMLYLPYTYYEKTLMSGWWSRLSSFLVKVKRGADPVAFGEKLKGYFELKYADTGVFNPASSAKLIAQMKLFLNVFSSLLAAVALIALLVGGVGINNMMLANLSERLKELGLRKSLGATPQQLRSMLLGESLILCLIAGFIGLASGIAAYQGLIFAATKFMDDLSFEWVFEPLAFLLSLVAIVLTGLLSGIVPALKAERLDVMEAMRQDG